MVAYAAQYPAVYTGYYPATYVAPTWGDTEQRIGVATYFYTSDSGAQGNYWDRTLKYGGTVGLVILNPGTGPGTFIDSTYVAMIEKARASGARVLGYVSTRYAGTADVTRTTAAAMTDIDTWLDYYPDIDGIFLDEATADAGHQAYYQTVHDYVKATLPADRQLVVINPGQAVDESYMACCDILMSFEGTAAQYRDRANPSTVITVPAAAWERSYPAHRFWHIVHTIGSIAELDEMITLSREYRAGVVQFHDDGMPFPYGVLPDDPFWSHQVAAIARGDAQDDPQAAARTVYLTDPPAGSGLTAVLADGSNERAKVQAALDYVDATWGSGTVIGPIGSTVKCDTGITIPAQVQLRDTRLNAASMTGTGYLITVSDSDFVPLHNVRIDGPGDSTTVKGLSVTGVGNRFERVQIREFGVNIDLSANNTYINTFVQCAIGESALCVNQDFSTSGANNSGEKTIFRDCTFFNSTKVFHVTNNQGGLFVDGCSLDYSANMGYISTSHVFFTNCHIESNYVTTSSGWFFEPAYEARVHFTACNFMMGSTGGEGLRHIIKPSTGPSVNGRGRVIFGDTCTAYFVDTAHNGQQRFADELVWVDPSTTSKTFETPFVSNWGPVTAAPGRYQGDTQAQATATVAIGHSSGTVSGSVTVTVPSTVPTSTYLPVRVTF